MSGDLFYSGKAVCIRFARTERGDLPAKEFLDMALRGKRRDPSARSLVAKMQRFADHGPTNNEHHYKHLVDELYEFKAGQLRLLCAWQGEELVLLLNGFKKKQQGTRRQELERAQRLQRKPRRLIGVARRHAPFCQGARPKVCRGTPSVEATPAGRRGASETTSTKVVFAVLSEHRASLEREEE